MARYLKAHKLPKEGEITIVGNVRPMEEKDVKAVQKLLHDYLKKTSIKLRFTDKEITHMLLPRENVVQTYVIDSPDGKKVTDFISYYSLPSTILKKVGH
jgi:glycylpeptide N-tetradecanoyltransferase